MKAAAVIIREDEYSELGSYTMLMERIEKRLILCCKNGVDVAVFPALLGCLFNSGEKYLNDIKEMSKGYEGLAICPGSYYEKAFGNTYHSSCIIMEGEILLRQRQLYLAKWEKAMNIARGETLESISIGGLQVGLLISTDVFYPQVSRAFAAAGVEMILSPVAIIDKYSASRQLSGLWQNVQANLFFGVESCFAGSYAGRRFNGRSMLHAPLGMTREEDGFLAKDEEKHGQEIVLAEIENRKRIEAVRKFNALAQLNIDAYKGIFPGTEREEHND